MILSPNLKLGDGSTGIVWDDPPCPLCSGERRTPVVEAPDRMPGGSGLRFAVVRCGECGLHFTSPRPNRATIGQFYGHDNGPGRAPPVQNGSATLADFLEHSHDPLAVLTELRGRLGTGDRLTVEVSNIESSSFRRFAAAWVGLDLPRRLIHFSPATLRRTLERAGFRVTELRTIARADWVQTSARLTIRSGRATLWQRALAYRSIAGFAAVTSYLAGAGDQIAAVAVV